MVDSDPNSAFSLSSLLCEEETEVSLDGEEKKEEEDEIVEFNPKDDEEYVKLMFEKEISNPHQCSSQFTTTSSSRQWIIRARSDAIQWIINARALFGFRIETAYLSVSYLDRFMSERVVDSDKHWAIRLLGVACLSLAAKMEECKVPALSEFPMEEYNFESKVIQRMELLVSSTLEWRMDSVTPFAFINFFVSKFSNSRPRTNIVSSASELIFATTGDITFIGYRPSVVAAVAALVALDQKLPREAMELKINACCLNQFLQIEDLFSCYKRMQEFDMHKDKLSKYMQSPDLSPMQVDGSGKASVTSGFSAKRKRLAFNDFDQNNAMPAEKQHY